MSANAAAAMPAAERPAELPDGPELSAADVAPGMSDKRAAELPDGSALSAADAATAMPDKRAAELSDSPELSTANAAAAMPDKRAAQLSYGPALPTHRAACMSAVEHAAELSGSDESGGMRHVYAAAVLPGYYDPGAMSAANPFGLPGYNAQYILPDPDVCLWPADHSANN